MEVLFGFLMFVAIIIGMLVSVVAFFVGMYLCYAAADGIIDYLTNEAHYRKYGRWPSLEELVKVRLEIGDPTWYGRIDKKGRVMYTMPKLKS